MELDNWKVAYLLYDVDRMKARIHELEEAIRTHRDNNHCKDHGIFWWKIDTELYKVLENVR